jgi:outer membrane lipoprotein-sorting protein
MLTLGLILLFCLITSATYGFGEQAAPMVQQENAPNVDEILERMKAHDEWQQRYLIEYQAQRKFSATNLRFKEDATLEVRTTFRRPDTLESQVLRADGSKFIRERVFDKILEAESETQSTKAKQQVDIVPANYTFGYIGREDCDGRECYRLRIAPKRKEKYLVEGQIWIDAEDWGIVQVQGFLAKRPSFWARQTQIDRRYKRIDGMWLNDRIESISDVFIAGRSSLTIQYSYESIQTDPQYESPAKSALLITTPSLPHPGRPIPYLKKSALGFPAWMLTG